MITKIRKFWGKKSKSSHQKVLAGEFQDGQGVITPGLMAHNAIPQPPETKFEDAVDFEPEQHMLIYCMNGQDNVPTRVKHENGFVYYISQNRSPGHKDQGQDCIATASQGDWELHVLCDGHDRMGHMVALGICQQLPKIILRKIVERDNSDSPESGNDPISDKLMEDAFDECARVVCWTKDGISIGLWVKVFEGEWAGKPGFIKERETSSGEVKVAIIDENGYHIPSIPTKYLRRPRYTGGCTCICMIRNLKTLEYKVAVSGDSRMMILPTMGLKDAILLNQPGLEENDTETPAGLLTPAHNVFNESEKDRLERDFSGQYEFDGNFLVNPITKFAIQPTRGFGDFDMFGTGYTHRPEITNTFTLQPNGLILTASDGLFDEHVWRDEEIVSCLDTFVKDGLTNVEIIDRMYRETLERSLEGGYVDDISIYVFKQDAEAVKTPDEAEPTKKEEVLADKELPTAKTVKKKRNTKQNRRTIGRGAAAFTDISAKVQELKKKMGDEGGKEAELQDIAQNDSVKEDVEGLVNNMAKTHKVQDKLDASFLLVNEQKDAEGEEDV